MKQIPILFSTPMVQAILDLIKKITRRTRGLEVINENPDQWEIYTKDTPSGKVYHFPKLNDFSIGFVNKDTQQIIYAKCPYGMPGDILWVRETFAVRPDDKFEYKTEYMPDGLAMKWKPSIHMPKVASRIFLENTGVRIERLQDISEGDCILEGVRMPVNEGKILWALGVENNAISFMPDDKADWNQKSILFAHWAELWCKVNGRESWDLNPWVWVIAFDKTEKPV